MKEVSHKRRLKPRLSALELCRRAYKVLLFFCYFKSFLVFLAKTWLFLIMTTYIRKKHDFLHVSEIIIVFLGINHHFIRKMTDFDKKSAFFSGIKYICMIYIWYIYNTLEHIGFYYSGADRAVICSNREQSLPDTSRNCLIKVESDYKIRAIIAIIKPQKS